MGDLFLMFLMISSISYAGNPQSLAGINALETGHKLVITSIADDFQVTFKNPDNTNYAKGFGYQINDTFYFCFKRTDQQGDGGYAVYKIKGNQLVAKHFNLDNSERWKGVYTLQSK